MTNNCENFLITENIFKFEESKNSAVQKRIVNKISKPFNMFTIEISRQQMYILFKV